MKIRAWDESEKTLWTLQDAGETSENGSVQFFGSDDGEFQFGRVEYIDTGMGFDDVFTPFPIDYFTAVTDINGKQVFSGDIVNASSFFHQVTCVVKFGQYEQDGSGGEYPPEKCIGFYVEIVNPEEKGEFGHRKYHEFQKTSSLLEYEKIEVIGNIYENPELLKGESE